MNAWIESVYSDGSQYFVSNPFPKMYEKVTIYIRLLETAPIDKIFIYTEINGVSIKKEMYRDRVENGLVYYKIKIGTSDDILSYSFMLLSDKIYYYTQKGITTYHQNVDYNFKILFGYATPVWAKKSICYQIFVDRFNKSNLDDFDLLKNNKIVSWNLIPVDYNLGIYFSVRDDNIHGLSGDDLEVILDWLDANI